METVPNDRRNEGLKIRYKYQINSTKVCKTFFMYVHNVTKKELQRLQLCHRNNDDYAPKWKGNHKLSFDLYQNLQFFMKTYFALHVQPNPSGPDEHLLPSVLSLREMHLDFCKKYKEARNLDESNKDPLSWKTFNDYYNNVFPYLKKLTKKTDFCDLCCKQKQKITDRSTTPEDKANAQEELQKHVQEYTEARKAYSDHRLLTAKEDGYTVISMDYAENINLPHLITQPASFYFHTLRKIDIFGITNEDTDDQLNFLIDECFRIKKGPNSVISMLDFYIHNFVKQGSDLILYCDNCGGQNKNQFLIGYMSYLVKIKKFLKECKIYFMIVGHTKFSPDRHFGNLKQKLFKENIYSISNLIGGDGIVNTSAKNN